MKHIVLCADDYGQNLPISQGIIALLDEGRLSATSCLTNSPDWPTYAKWLLPFLGRADIGMHFNLTEGKALSSVFRDSYGPELLPLRNLMLKAYLRQLKLSVIEAECHAQLDRFIAAIGKTPDFIDGHQHTHQLPIVRDALLNVCAKRLSQPRFYIRCVNERLILADWCQGQGMKKSIILLGASRLQWLLGKSGIHHNTSFSGIYSFARAKEYSVLFPRFLDAIKDGGLILCHPGWESSAVNDPIAWVRGHEYRYFASNQFLTDCAKHEVVISRFY